MVNPRRRAWPLIMFWAVILCAVPGLASAGGEVVVINLGCCPGHQAVAVALVFHEPGMMDGEWVVLKTVHPSPDGGSATMQADDQGKQRVWRLFVVGLGTKPGDKLHCRKCEKYPVITPPCTKTIRYDPKKNIAYYE